MNRFSIRIFRETYCGRAGFTWQVRNRNRHVIRFGWGIGERRFAQADARNAIHELHQLEREHRKAHAA